MNTELFVLRTDNEPNTILNSSFSEGDANWNITTPSVTLFDYNAAYGIPDGVNPFMLNQSNILNGVGRYRLKFTLLNGLSQTYMSGYIYMILGANEDGNAITLNCNTHGSYLFDLYVNDVTDKSIYIWASHHWNGGITNITLEKTDGYWYPLDLGSDIQIPLTFNIADVVDITSRNSDFSKTITIPGNSNNNQFLKHAYNISTSGSFELNKPTRCNVVQDSKTILDGSIELINSTIINDNIYYEALVYGDFSNFASIIGNKYLIQNDNGGDDLDFSEYDHERTLSTLQNSFTLPLFTLSAGSGIVYVPIDKYNKYSEADIDISHRYRYSEMSACLFIKEIFDKIFSKAGFTYESTFLNSDYFKHLIYPDTQPYFSMTQIEKDARSCVVGTNEFSTTYIDINSALPCPPYLSNLTGRMYLNLITNGAYAPFDTIDGKFICRRNGFYDIDININITMGINVIGHNSVLLQTSNPYIATYSDIWLKKSTGEISLCSLSQVQLFPLQVYTDANGNYEIQNGILTYKNKIYMSYGDEIYIWNRITVQKKRSDCSGNFLWLLPTYGTTAAIRTYVASYEDSQNRFNITANSDFYNIKANQILHKVKQIDFINSIFKMFNLYCEQISNKHFVIEPRDNYLALNTSSKDWTTKLCRDKEFIIERVSDISEKVLDFTYAYDDDYFNKYYKDNANKIYGEYISIGENNRDVTNTLKQQLIFAATPSAKMSNATVGLTMENPKIFTLNSDNTVDLTKKYSPRILYWSGMTSVLTSDSFSLSDEDGYTITTYTGQWPYCGHLDAPFGNDTKDLNFASCDKYYTYLGTDWSTWNNLYNTYWNKYITELRSSDSKLVSCYLYLTPTDISNIRFYNSIFIDGIYYRINKIIDYVPNNPVRVELIKVNEVIVSTSNRSTKVDTVDYDILNRDINYNITNRNSKSLPTVYNPLIGRRETDLSDGEFYLNVPDKRIWVRSDDQLIELNRTVDITYVSGDTVLSLDDRMVVGFSSSSAITLYLPSCSGATLPITIKNNAWFYNIIVWAYIDLDEIIDYDQYYIIEPRDSLTIIPDGVNIWYTIEKDNLDGGVIN